MMNDEKTKDKETTVPRGGEPAPGPEADARGQSEKTHAGGSNDGMTSAEPRSLSGKKSGDATFPLKGPKRG